MYTLANMAVLSWFEDYGNEDFYGFDMTKLDRDEAYLTITKEVTDSYIYQKHKECIGCPYILSDINNKSRNIISDVPQYLYRVTRELVPFLKENDDFYCDVNAEIENNSTLGEFGIYNLIISDSGCVVRVVKDPVSITFPILSVVMIYVAVILGVLFSRHLIRTKFLAKSNEDGSDDDDGNAGKKERIRSLDTFRGISIVIMIFVNYGAGGYDFLDHAIWNGLHLADLVFPWFMWIMGVCIPISLASSIKRQIPKKTVFFGILQRSIKLFLVGLFLASGTRLPCLRLFGVLQRFGICYLVVTSICLIFAKDPKFEQGKFRKHFKDILQLLKGWLSMFVVLIIYCLILFLVTEPNCPTGYFGPGGLHNNGDFENCTGGATGYVDRLILNRHMYRHPTFKSVYKSHKVFDPEGILGCLPSIIHVFIGVQAGSIISVYKKHHQRILRWLIWAAITGLTGGILCNFSKDGGFIPVNKNLWSLSFVLVTSSFSFTLLSICYVLVDVKKWWSGKPFLYAGMNAIIMYIGHSMTYNHFPVRWNSSSDCTGGHRTHFLYLFENVWATGFWMLVSYYLYKIKYFFNL